LILKHDNHRAFQPARLKDTVTVPTANNVTEQHFIERPIVITIIIEKMKHFNSVTRRTESMHWSIALHESITALTAHKRTDTPLCHYCATEQHLRQCHHCITERQQHWQLTAHVLRITSTEAYQCLWLTATGQKDTKTQRYLIVNVLKTVEANHTQHILVLTLKE
jgi:hypothetical protein